MPLPVTTGCAVGVVDPAGMKTLEGEIATVLVSLVASATTTPPAGAGEPICTAMGADCPSATDTPVASVIVPGDCTRMVVVASETFDAVTWITVEPAAL